MANHERVLSKTTPRPAQLSETLKHISRTLNARGFVLRKRHTYVIEPMVKIAAKPDSYRSADLTNL